ncbi:MAG: ankyrin repeat domain-containing protein [Thermodesulfobacteriota bacterium]
MSHPSPQLVVEAKFRDRSRIEELLDQGVDVDAVDDKGRTALMWAASWGRHDIVQLLLERGAQADIRDGYGETALIKAARRGREDIVETLINLGGADPRACDNWGKTALDKALDWGKGGVADVLEPAVESPLAELLEAEEHEPVQEHALPISESDLFSALQESSGTAVLDEEGLEAEDEEGPLNDTIEVVGLSLYEEELGETEPDAEDAEFEPASEPVPREPDLPHTGGERPKKRLSVAPEPDRPAAQSRSSESPSEDDLMALFDSYDELGEGEREEPVEVEGDVTDVDLSDEATVSDDWALAVAGEDEDLIALDEDDEQTEDDEPFK